MNYRYILFHKPFNVLSQFTPENDARTLAEFGLPKDVYPAGRLDKDSEGLLLLTNDGPLIEKILKPSNEKEKTYWALVEKEPSYESIQQFEQGLLIENYKTMPAKLKVLTPQPEVPPRDPPVRIRKAFKDFWVEITLTEGKNRQVRKMTAAIGHPTIRLIRKKILNCDLENLSPGEWREIEKKDIKL